MESTSPTRPSLNETPSGTSSGASSLSSSAAQPSPLAVFPVFPGILEDEADEDDERPPRITIEDEQVDECPFDPSIPDEVFIREFAAAQSAAVPIPTRHTEPSMHERLGRLLAVSPRMSVPGVFAPAPGASPNAEVAPDSHTHRWKARLSRLRGSLLKDEIGEQEVEEAGEHAVVLSCRSSVTARMGLIPLSEAQGRADIVHRPEGFELAEARNRGLP